MEVPLKEKLSRVPFPFIFYKIVGEKRSGVLSLADIETKKVRKRIGFKAGRQAYVAGGTINETLGRLLLKHGKITEQQYHESLTKQKKENKKTGEVLVEMGIMDGAGLAEALQVQTEEKILGCFTWPDGIYSFTEAEPPEGKQLLFFPIRPEKIVLEGIRRYYDQQHLEKIFTPYLETKFQLTSQASEIQQKLGLAPAESRVVQHFKSGYGIRDLLSASPAEAVSTLKVMYLMLVTGIVQPLQQKAAAQTGASQSADGAQAAAQPQAASAKAQKNDSGPAQPGAEAKAVRPEQQQKAANPQASQTQEVADGAQAAAEEPPSPQVVVEGEDEGPQFAVEGEDDVGTDYAAQQEAQAAPKAVREERQPDPEEEKRNQQIMEELNKYEKIIKEGTHFDLLGVEREAKPLEIKKAFFRLAKKFHPDTNPAFFKGQFREQAEDIFTHIGEAYNTLVDPKAREEYVYALDHQISDEDLEKANRALEAEGIFVKAEILFKKGDFRGAKSLLEDAINLNPDEPEYYVYRGWSRYKSSQGAEIQQAREDLRRALDMGLRDKIDMAHYYLGMLAKVEKRPPEEMKKHFTAALEVNPNHPQAATELRHLEMHTKKEAADQEKKKGGLFGRFKK